MTYFIERWYLSYADRRTQKEKKGQLMGERTSKKPNTIEFLSRFVNCKKELNSLICLVSFLLILNITFKKWLAFEKGKLFFRVNDFCENSLLRKWHSFESKLNIIWRVSCSRKNGIFSKNVLPWNDFVETVAIPIQNY